LFEWATRLEHEGDLATAVTAYAGSISFLNIAEKVLAKELATGAPTSRNFFLATRYDAVTAGPSGKAPTSRVHLHDVEKRKVLCEAELKARLFAATVDPKHVVKSSADNVRGTMQEAEDVVGRLCKTGLYSTAARVCRVWDMKVDKVCEALTDRVVAMTR
jgi:hypothetical protein